LKVLVTGGAGFIGSHLVDALVKAGHNVIVFDNLFRGKIEHIQSHIDDGSIEFIEGDIRNYEQLKEACRGCEMVFHLAAQSNVIGAVSNLNYSFESNVIGTFNTLRAAYDNNIQRFVFSSSREVYGEANYTPVDEQHPLLAKNSYGASKVAGEVYCSVFRKMGINNLTILRLANVYGNRDFDRVIPIFLELLTSEKRYEMPINIGSGKGTSLFDLVDRIEDVLQKKAKIVIEPSREVEVKKFVANINSMEELFSSPPPANPLYFLKEMIAL